MSDIQSYYDDYALYELERLDRHRTELAVTFRALADYLPEPPSTILDLGGGPGRYSIALAQEGHSVTLLDLSASCLEIARKQAAIAEVQLAGYVHGDARDLSMFPTKSYDSVLLMGPLYHLPSLKDRLSVLIEARRVLKSQGIIFAAFVTRYAPILNAAYHTPLWITEQREQLERLLSTGAAVVPWSGKEITGYFAHPTEIRPLMEKAGFETIELLACEGVVGHLERRINELKGEAWDDWVNLNYRLARDSSLHGSAAHLLCIARRQC